MQLGGRLKQNYHTSQHSLPNHTTEFNLRLPEQEIVVKYPIYVIYPGEAGTCLGLGNIVQVH